MNGRRIKIFNGRILTPFRMITGGCVVITDQRIDSVNACDVDVPDAVLIDARGCFIAPGFIDLHVHGGGGHDFMDGTETAFREIARVHAQHGTTAMTPTTLSCGKQDLLDILSVYDQTISSTPGDTGFLGMHLEGPYLAMSQRGAQDPRYIRNPEPDEYTAIATASANITRWSAAPELPGAPDFGKFLCSKKILPAIAHTDAIYEEVIRAFDNGFTHVTHLYSAMSGVTRKGSARYAGVIESAFLIDGMTVEIIADGMHLPPALLQLVYKIKGAEQTALITDAMRGAGMPEGDSILGSNKNGLQVIVEDGVAKLPDRSAFAGSVATANLLVRNMVNLAGVPICDAVSMITHTPARIMNVHDRKGSLEPGKDADLVLFDDAISIRLTIAGGRIIYKSPDLS